MKISQKMKDLLIILIPILFIVSIVMAINGNGFWGILAPVLITGILTFLGLITGDTINIKMVLILVIGFLIVHGGGIVGSVYYHTKHLTEAPSQLIMGLHPSWFHFMIVYWLGSFIYQAVAFVLLKDTWLPDEKWDNFVKKIDSAQSSNNKERV